MQKVTDPPPKKCDGCGAKKLSKVVSRTSFQLKGGGWYSDLYGSTKPKKAESTAAAPAAEKPAKAPAAKSPAKGDS
jgi:predicted nucleic acid-binding Zn ribbon protein